MKKLILHISICFIASRLCALGDKPAVAKISSCPHMDGVVDIKVSLGEHVREKQLLFKISTDYTEITKEQCKNSVWYYKEEYERVKNLAKVSAKSKENVQEAKYNLEHAIERLKVALLLINKWSKYYAPFDGVITRINNYSGSGVSHGSGSCDNNNAILEVMKLEDYKKGTIKIGPAVARVAPMINGIVELKVKDGEKVKKGQLLFKIDTTFYEIRKAKRMASLEYNKAKYERAKQLYKQNSGSLKYYQTTVYDYENAVLELKGTELLIHKRSSYFAPFEGTVTDITYYTGSYVFTGHKVLEITKV
jgi:multidrug resistance efflux pump